MWRISLTDKLDSTMVDLNGPLTQIQYKGSLPITDLSYVFMKIVHTNSSNIGITQTPERPCISLGIVQESCKVQWLGIE